MSSFDQCARIREAVILHEPLSFAARCQLALISAISKETDLAASLASSLAPLIEEGFMTLWSCEDQYDPVETEISISLLSRALGKKECERPKDPYFAWIYDQNPKIEAISFGGDYELVHGENSALVLTNHFHAGAFRVGAIRASAFGPHALPLSNSKLFGVSTGENRWISAKGDKESWIQITPIHSRAFDLQSINDRPIPFVFYIQADFCQIGERVYKPKSLQRFDGVRQTVRFGKEKEFIEMSVDTALPIELIPLAGVGPFWGASFLLAFQIPPMSGKIRVSY